MNDPAPHVIATHAIQIEMDRENGARGILELAAGLGKNRLAADAEELFSAYAPPHRRVRIDRLELALGTIPEEQFAEEFPARFRAALEAELERQLGRSLAVDAPVDKPPERAASLLDTLEHVLLHGTLPWWSAQESNFDPVSTLEDELRLTPARLGALVRRIGGHKRVRTRLVHWLADPPIVALIRTVAPADAGFIERYAADLEVRQREERLVPANSDEFRQAKWEVILSQLLVDHGSHFNAKSFLRRTIRDLAAHFGVDHAELLGHLVRIARMTEKHWGESSLPRLLTEIHAEDFPGVERTRTESAVEEAVACWTEELARPAGASPAVRRDALAFWRKLSPASLWEIVTRLVEQHGLPAVAARLAALFDPGARRELHRLLLAARGSGPSSSVSTIRRDPPHRRALTALTGLADEPEPAADERSAETAALPALRIFLETGRLPDDAWAGRAGAWLLVILAEHAEALPLLLRRWAKAGRLTAAMSRHLDDALLEAVVETVEPAHAEEVMTFVRTARAVPEAEFPGGAGTAEFQRETWQVVLDYLLEEHGSVFNRREFLRRSVRELSARHGVASGVLLEFLARAAQSTGRQPLARDLDALREESVPPVAAGEIEPVDPPPRVHDEAGADGFTETTLRRSRLARLRFLREVLRDAATARGVATPALLPALWELLRTVDGGQPDAWHEILRRNDASQAVDVMLATQGEDVLAAAVFAGEPAQAEAWQECVAWLEQSQAATTLFPGGRQGLRGRLWRALLARWREGGGRPVRDIAALLVSLLLDASGASAANPVAAESLLRETLRAALVRDGSQAARRLAAGMKGPPPPPRRSAPPPPARTMPPPPSQAPLQPITVSNAGLVLLATHFATLHARCGLLDGEQFRDFRANQRAVHLLQYLVTGGRRTHEYSLVLNKILCGLNPENPVVPEIELTEREKTAAQELLENVAREWPRGAAISPDGIRGSYLWRPGVLTRREQGWELWVEPRGWDILLPELPWGFSFVQSAWMPEPLRVDWI